MIEQLGSTEGETVLEVGCSPGINFELLREAVGPTGTVIGLDYSAETIQQAAIQIHNHGWAKRSCSSC